MIELKDLILDLKPLESELIKLRRLLHAVPEIGDNLPLTKNIVCDYLNKVGIEYRCFDDFDGVVAQVKGDHAGKTIAFRADMDALHIDEQNDTPYSSKIAGQMHGCGHDAHTAILLIVARYIHEHRNELKGSVRFIFQTGEETGTGAKHMLANNAIDGVDCVFALHVGNLAGNGLNSGEFAILPGFASAGKIKFTITIKGKGTHSAFPERGIDPIPVLARIISGSEELVAREVPGGTAAIISFGNLSAGVDHNTIPETATLKGSIRCQDPTLREFLAQRLEQLSTNLAKAYRAECIIQLKRSSESIRNDDSLAIQAASAVAQAIGKERVKTILPNALMASDDFSDYAKRIPSVYFLLHTNNDEKGISEPNHSPRFDLDEDLLIDGAVSYVAIALDILK